MDQKKCYLLFVLFLIQCNLFGQDFFEVVSTSKLNVRNAPSTTSKIVGTLNPGDEIFVFNTKGEWAVFNYENRLAYVFMKYLKKCESNSVETEVPVNNSVEETNHVTYEPVEIIKETKKEILVEELPESSKKEGQKPYSFNLGVAVEGGYTNFACDGVTPKYGWGYGANVSIQLLLKDYFSEFSLGYVKKGSGAFPLDYAICRLYPVGYKLDLSSCVLYGKVGGYIGHCFSNISTYYDSFSCELDWGLSAGIGVEYEQFSLGVNYEHGFSEVCSSNLDLYNRNIFLTFSYNFMSF